MSLGVKDLLLVNRSRERAEDLAARYQLGVDEIENLPELMADADLVIVATAAQEPVITMEHMEASMTDGRQKVMLDLSVPRNIDPQIGELDMVDLANMDLLSDVTDEAYKKREENIPLVKQIIEDEYLEYQQWINEQRVVPTIKALTHKFDEIRQAEIDRFQKQLCEEDLEKVEHLTRRIVNKIAAHSIDHLRENHQKDEITDLVKDMFKLQSRPETQ